MNVIFRLDTYDLLFGVPNEEKDITINQFNFIILMARHQIYRAKLKGVPTDLYTLLLNCKAALSK